MTLWLARSHPVGSFAGDSIGAAGIEAAAAIGLVGTGLLLWRGSRGSGHLLVLAGFAWLAVEWTNPQAGFAPLFTLGLAAVAATVGVVTHLALAYPAGTLSTRSQRVVVAATYVAGIGALGLAPLAFFDARAQGCLECPRNLLLVHGDPAVYLAVSRWGIRAALVVFAIAAIAIALRAWRSSRAILATSALLFVAAFAYLVLVEIDLLHSLGRGVLSNDQTDVQIWKAQGVCLLLIAGAAVHGLWRARAMRNAMAGLVVELAQAPRLGGARDLLAEALGDPQLRLWYRRPASSTHVDSRGMAAEVRREPGRAVTRLVRERDEIALMDHDAELLAQPRSIEAAIAAAALAVDNERLEAELLAQAREMRESRRRIVATADRSRRTLERDLHDGAQQRLVGLSLGLQLLRLQTVTASSSAQIERAEEALRVALAQLREIAHGIYPASLRDEGLQAALEDLAEHLSGHVRISSSATRVAPELEEAAYFAAMEILRDVRAGEGPASVGVATAEGGLVLEIERRGVVDGLERRLIDISDRVGAVGGRLGTETRANGLGFVVRIPCE